MDIIVKEAKEYAYEFFGGELICNIENLSSKLSSKLYSFRRTKDKIIFLNELRNEVKKEKIEHEKTCKTVDCYISKEKDAGIFVIDQELEDLSQTFQHEPNLSDRFDGQEQSNLYESLDEIKIKLAELGFGQQIIFDELDELKQHFNLGKKNWFQLLKGKLFDLSLSKAIEETIVKDIYKKLSKGLENLPELIDKI